MDLQTITRLSAYHHWASDRHFDAVAALPGESLDRALGGSFGSIGDLIRHMLGADTIWLMRWNGTSPAAVPDAPTWRTAADFQRVWAELKDGQRRFLAAQSDASLAGDLRYTTLNGTSYATPLGDVLLHVVNHGTYHRGQLAHMLRQLEHRPPSTDYVFYLRETTGASR